MIQTKLFEPKVEFIYVESVIGSGYEDDVAKLAIEDKVAYRDCRCEFFNFIETTIQASITNPIKGSERILDDISIESRTNNYRLPEQKTDIIIDTPLIYEKKEETMKRILNKYGVNVYIDSYTCYNGNELSCGKCPSCQERFCAHFLC